MEKQPAVNKITLIALAAFLVLGLALFHPVYRVFQGKTILPQTFDIFGLPGHYYGLLMFFALFFGYLAARQLGKLHKIELDHYIFSVFLGFFWALVGARIGYVIFKLDTFQSFWQYFAIWQGGLSIHGALVAVALYLFWWTRRFKFNFWQMADILAPGIALGTAIARWGNFFNQEAYGLPTTLPWKMFIDQNHRMPGYILDKFYHPTFLYESLLAFILFLILIQVFAKDFKKGTVALVYLLGYSLIRFGLEFLRIDSEKWLILTIAQWVSLGILVLALILLFRRKEHA